MDQAIQQVQPIQDSYYSSYLLEAVAIFEDAIKRLRHCENSQCDVADAIDMAHRIKGNAAMYGYPDLGLSAKKTEEILRDSAGKLDHVTSLKSIINLVDNIEDICQRAGKSEPVWLHDTLAVEDEKQTQVSQSAPSASFDRKRVIIAFQDSWICDLMASLLEPEYAVSTYNTGKDALTAIMTEKSDLTILEHEFSDMSGLDLLMRLRTAHPLNDLPVFMAFAPDMPEAIAQAISCGINGFTEDKHEILEITDFTKTFFGKPKERVLVVDDDPIVRDLLKDVLRGAGFIVDIASDGLEALAYLSKQTPDIVLLDRFMPRLEGGTVLYEIQNKINLKSIPVLILTAMVNQGEAKSWFERGAADFIPKPFDPDEVVMRVKQHLETRQM